MPSIYDWAQHPGKVLDIIEGTKDEELGKVFAWLYTKGDADVAMELTQRIMDNARLPTARTAEGLAQAVKLVIDAYFTAQEDQS